MAAGSKPGEGTEVEYQTLPTKVRGQTGDTTSGTSRQWHREMNTAAAESKAQEAWAAGDSQLSLEAESILRKPSKCRSGSRWYKKTKQGFK